MIEFEGAFEFVSRIKVIFHNFKSFDSTLRVDSSEKFIGTVEIVTDSVVLREFAILIGIVVRISEVILLFKCVGSAVTPGISVTSVPICKMFIWFKVITERYW